MHFKTIRPEHIQFDFLHGWGFTGECWKFLQYVMPAGIIKHFFNRGYWGQAAPVSSDAVADMNVAVSHSLGLHFVSGKFLDKIDHLVIVSGFRSFHGMDGNGGVTHKHIKRMQARLTSEPQALMDDFYRDCSYPREAPGITGADLSLLQKDLRLLDTSVYDTEVLQTKNVLILHGAKDRIVPLARAEEMHEALPNSQLQICRQAGHGLPFTHPDFVMQSINDFLQITHSE